MACPPDPLPDWREDRGYLPLLRADRSIFAWEWLRRQEGYRDDREASRKADGAGQPERWGLHAFVDPALAAPAARPMWRRDVYRQVLEADALVSGDKDGLFDLHTLGPLATVERGPDGEEHLLLTDGLREIRVDVRGGSVLRGPALLRYRLAGLSKVDGPLLVLRRFLALYRGCRFSPALHPPETRARRWIAMLRARDGMAAGATQRELAEVLLSHEAGEARWRIAAPTIRSRIQRLARAARQLDGRGYVSLLERKHG